MDGRRQTDRQTQEDEHSPPLCQPAMGDPLASLLFSLALQPIIKIIAQRVPRIRVNAWYLDDGAIVGKKEELQEAVDILQEHGPARGLILSTSATTNNNPKSSVWCPSAVRAVHLGADILDRGIPLVEDTGIVILGSPIGSVEFERRVIGERMKKIGEISSMLSLIEDSQIEYALLRSCLSSPKFTFTLRTSNPSHHLNLWQDYDRITRGTLCHILGSTISDQQWWQATLPVSAGGLGIRAAEDHCQAAYITSLLGAQDLKQTILGRSAEECPPLVTANMLQGLAAKTGQEETIACLKGSTQK